MNRPRKTRDEYRLLINYGYDDGWEHETTEDSWQEMRQQIKAYRENCPQYPVRYIKKRVPIAATLNKGSINGQE